MIRMTAGGNTPDLGWYCMVLGENPTAGVIQWVDAFYLAAKGGRETLKHNMGSGGIVPEDPNDCFIDADVGEDHRWLARHYRQVNRLMRQVIAETVGLEGFRAMLEANQAVEDPDGDFFTKDFAARVLENFVDTDAWC